MQGAPPFGRSGVPLSDSQGPDWLAKIVLNPPSWVNDSLKLLAVVVALVVAYRLYQFDFRLPVSTQVEMQRVVAHVLGVMLASLALVTYADLPYVWDAGLGATIGVGAALGVQPVARRLADRYVSTDARERATAGWTALLTVALILPGPAGIQQSGYLVVNARWYVVVLCGAMAFYNVALIQRERTSLD